MVGRAQSAAQALQYATSRTALRRAFFPACCHVPPLRIKKTPSLPLLMLPHSYPPLRLQKAPCAGGGFEGEREGGGGRCLIIQEQQLARGKWEEEGGGPEGQSVSPESRGREATNVVSFKRAIRIAGASSPEIPRSTRSNTLSQFRRVMG